MIATYSQPTKVADTEQISFGAFLAYSCVLEKHVHFSDSSYCAYIYTYRFGMLHDGQNNVCPADSNKIMSGALTSSSNLYLWSSCSADYLAAFLMQSF